tara:strand:- start:61 stop:648 length:588 start_codon:yes stop_codon:yes gene_type:complete
MTRSIQPDPPAGFNYHSSADFVLDRGVDMVSSALTDEELKYVLSVIDASPVGRFQQKQCYYNAQCVVLSDQEGLLKYQEGIAHGRGFLPVNHGWFTINDKVIDLTWRTEKPNHKGRLRDRVFGVIPDEWVYRGVHFDKHLLIQRMLDTKALGTVIDDWPTPAVFKMERISPCAVEPFVWPPLTTEASPSRDDAGL